MFRTDYAFGPAVKTEAQRPTRVWVKVDGKLECRWAPSGATQSKAV